MVGREGMGRMEREGWEREGEGVRRVRDGEDGDGRMGERRRGREKGQMVRGSDEGDEGWSGVDG
jgi:hypothetical protein